MPPTSSLAARTIRAAVSTASARHVGIRQELDRRRLHDRLRHGARAVAVVGIAHRRRAQVEASVGLDPHRVEQLAAEEFQADDALVGVVRQVLLQQEQVVRQPDAGIAQEDRVDLRERFHHLDARAAAALIGLQQGRPRDLVGIRTQRAHVVEGDRARAIDAEGAQQRRLCALAQLEREHVGAVEHPCAQPFEGSHVGERQRHRSRVAAQIRARAGLIEVERRAERLDVAERRSRDVERHERDAAPLERREQRLLPFRMFVNDDEIGSRVAHGWGRSVYRRTAAVELARRTAELRR